MLLIAVFLAHIALAAAAYAIAPRLGRRKGIAITVCITAFALMLAWPLMRFFPVLFINILGAPLVACVELTGLAIPAVLLFAVAATQVPKKSDAKALRLLILMCGIYFLKAGWWMISTSLPGLPGVPKLGEARMPDGICRQTTGATCVAASMVTMLHAYGIESTEAEMARLAHIDSGGATDSRALWALQRKLAGTGCRAKYGTLSREQLIAAPKPCMVQLDWGFFISHMVTVIEMTDKTVTLGDPITGRRLVSMTDFMDDWKGNAITLERKSE